MSILAIYMIVSIVLIIIGIPLLSCARIFSQKQRLQEKELRNVEKANENKLDKFCNQEKILEGVLLGLFMGISGLIVGICIYPENTISRSSFLRVWFLVCGISTLVSGLISLCVFFIISL